MAAYTARSPTAIWSGFLMLIGKQTAVPRLATPLPISLVVIGRSKGPPLAERLTLPATTLQQRARLFRRVLETCQMVSRSLARSRLQTRMKTLRAVSRGVGIWKLHI